MTASLADMHCHLELFGDPRALAEACAKENLRVLAVTASPRSWRKFQHMVDGIDGIRPALGLHPQLGGALEQELPLFESYLEKARYIGEVGLDGSRNFASTLPIQVTVLRRVLQATSEQGGKILSVHSVHAGAEVMALLESDFDFSKGRVVLHWFTASQELCRRAAQLGCYFSVNSQMLRSEKGRAIVRSIPKDRLLTETDGPFVLEQGKPVSPLDIKHVVRLLAKTRDVDTETLAVALASNLRALVTQTAP